LSGLNTTFRWTVGVVGAVLVGALLRLSSLDAMEFKFDEVEAIELGARLLEERPWSSDAPWPTHGMPSSQRVANPPLFNWMMAVLWAPTRDPVAAARLIALANTLSLFPLWLWARRRMDGQRALLTVSIVAVSPFAVFFSRKLWAQDLILPGLIAVWWGIEALRGWRPWRGLILLGAAALLVGQLHLSGAIALGLLPAAIAAQHVVDRRRGGPGLRFGRPTLLEGAALAGVIALNLFFALPYLEYLSRLPAGVFSDRPKLLLPEPALLKKVGMQVVPLDLFFFFRPHRSEFLRDGVRSIVFYASVGLGLPLLFYGLWRWLRSPFTIPVLGVWWWLVIAAFTLARIPSYPHYVVTLAPLAAVLAAGAFDGPLARPRLASALMLWRWGYVAALLGLTMLTQSWLASRGGAAGDYGIAYRIRLAQAQAVVDRLEMRTPASYAHWGEIGSGDATSVRCHRLPVQVEWIVRWLGPRQTQGLQSVQLCDEWVDRQDRFVYQWTIRP
jgi:hypothetical protein